MEIKEFKVKYIIHDDYIKQFIVKGHYSKSSPRPKICFGLFYNDSLVGVATFRHPIGRYQERYYGKGKKVLELIRLYLLDECPKNSESFFISKCITHIKKFTKYDIILALSDMEQNHKGIIYQASNFKCVGECAKAGNGVFIINGKNEHPRNLYAKYGTSDRKVMKEMFGDKCIIKERVPKIAYIYEIVRKSSNVGQYSIQNIDGSSNLTLTHFFKKDNDEGVIKWN